MDSNYENLFNEDAISFDVKLFYSFYNLDYDEGMDSWEKDSLWAQIYYNIEYNKEAYDYIYSIFKDSLVICYEADKWQTTIYEYFNIPYIEMNLDPIRFCEDLLWAFRSNVKEVYEKIIEFKTDESIFYASANLIKAYYSEDYSKAKEKAVLFLGQTSCDKTLVEPNTKLIYSILEHKEEFENAIKGFDKIYYKRHPFAYQDDEVIDYINSLGEVEITNENFYKLLCRDEVKKVVSISSGTCIEAKYFGKNSQNLLRESIPMNPGFEFEKEKYIHVFKEYFTFNFWSTILSPLIETVAVDEQILCYKNKLRNSRQMASLYYDYVEPEQEFAKQKVSDIFNPKIEDLEQRIKHLENQTLEAYFKRIKKTIEIYKYSVR